MVAEKQRIEEEKCVEHARIRDAKKAEKAVVAKAKEEAKAVKDAEKAAAAKVKEDAKIAKEMAKEAKKVIMAGHGGAVVGHGGATFVELATEQQATVEPVMVVPAISPGSQQRHEFPEEVTPWVLIEHLI